MQDNSNEQFSRATLTKIGRKRFNENRFNITKFALSDDGINYNLLNKSQVDPLLTIQRGLTFFPCRASEKLAFNKINPTSENFALSKHNFEIEVDPEPFEVVRSKERFDTARVAKPTISTNFNFKELRYRYTDLTSLKDKINSFVKIKFDSLPIRTNGSYLTVILHSNKVFDIALSQQNINLFSKDVTSENFETIKSHLLTNPTNRVRSIASLINTTASKPSLQTEAINPQAQFTTEAFITNDHVLLRNLEENLNVGISEISNYPKTLNVLMTPQTNANSFVLHYRGNGMLNYDTFITLFFEETGQYETIRLRIDDTQVKVVNDSN